MNKVLENFKPYNKFFLLSCFNQEQASIYEHYDVDDRIYIANNFLIHKFNRNKRICSCSFVPLFSEREMAEMTGVKKTSNTSSKNVVKDIISYINKDCPVIVFLDGYALPQKEDTYQKQHISHSVLVYGYDDEQKIFYDIDFKYNNNYTYENKTIPFDHVENAHDSFERNLRRRKDTKTLYAFEKKRKPIEFDMSFFQNRHKELISSAENSYRELKAFLDYLSTVFSDSEKCSKNAEKIKANLIKLKWEKLGQKHQLKYIYEDSSFADLLDTIHDHYSFILSVVFKYCFTKNYKVDSMAQCVLRLKEIIVLEEQILNYLRDKAGR